MFEVGQVCIKLSGREAGKKCVIIKKIDKNFVMIDGDVKRRKCNINHLFPTSKTLEVKSGAGTEAVKEALNKAGIVIKLEKKHKKEKKAKTARPRKQKKARAKEETEKPVKKAPIKKAAKKTEKKPEKKEEKKEEAKPEKKAVKKSPSKKSAKKASK